MIEMDEDEALRLIEVFREKAADRLYQLRLIAIEQSDDDHKHREMLKHRKEEEERKFEEALATPAQVAAFEEQLDVYDTATVKALMDNQYALEAIRKEREAIEATAFRLPDGRMVFKSDDGQHVYDKQGKEVGPDVIDPHAIPDGALGWNAERKIAEKENKKLGERDALHDFQRQLDEERQIVGTGEATTDVLAKATANLKRHMPAAVAMEIAGGKPDNAASMTAGSVLPVTPDRLPSRIPAPALVAP